MHRYPHLRVAYIDSIRLNRAGASAHETYHICLLLVAAEEKGIAEKSIMRYNANLH